MPFIAPVGGAKARSADRGFFIEVRDSLLQPATPQGYFNLMKEYSRYRLILFIGSQQHALTGFQAGHIQGLDGRIDQQTCYPECRARNQWIFSEYDFRPIGYDPFNGPPTLPRTIRGDPFAPMSDAVNV